MNTINEDDTLDMNDISVNERRFFDIQNLMQKSQSQSQGEESESESELSRSKLNKSPELESFDD